MTGNIGIGKGGMAFAVIVGIAMCLIGYFFSNQNLSAPDYGFCLPSPDSWELSHTLSWLLNLAAIAVIVITIYLINKHFNFIRTTEPALMAVFIIMACSNPWFTDSLNTSVLLCLANTIGLGVLFSSYDSKNATHQMFIIGVLIGIGSMFQYSFLSMVPTFILSALFVKVLRLKEILAFTGGILCVYWIGLGFGIIDFSEFHWPSLVAIFGNDTDPYDFFFLLAGIGVAMFIGLILSLTNAMKLFAGNSEVHAMNLCVTTMGAVSMLCIFADYENLAAYVLSLYLAVAVQIANICALWNIRRVWIVTAIPAVVYISLFVGSVIL